MTANRAARAIIEVTLYTRAECELCREMEEVLKSEPMIRQVDFKRIEIDRNPDLEASFGLEVPVLFINGRKAFKYRCTARQLRGRLAREFSR